MTVKDALLKSDELLSKQNAEEAITLLESFSSEPHAEIHQNLSVAYYQTGGLIKALAHSEQALTLNPSEPQISQLYQHLKKNSQVSYSTSDPLIKLSLIEHYVDFPTLFAPCGGLFLGILILGVIKKRRLGWIKKGLWLSWGISLILLLVSLWSLKDPEVVLVQATNPLRLGPSPTFPPTSEIGGGVRARVIENVPGWVRIQFNSELTGWVESHTVSTLLKPKAFSWDD